MRFLIDENIPRITVEFLRAEGHDVREIRGTNEEGISDELVWEIALGQGRILISTDKGFVKYRGALHPGILIVRLRQPNWSKIHDRIRQALKQFPGSTQWQDRIVIMRDATKSVLNGEQIHPATPAPFVAPFTTDPIKSNACSHAARGAS
jgi:predicted nuclease of predicted toxin-antitoxin system